MKPLGLIKAIYVLWKNDPILGKITLRSTRIPPSTKLPYAIIEAKHVSHKLCSALYFTADYDVTITLYIGQDKVLANSLSNELGALLDFKKSTDVTVEGIYILSVLPDYENPDLDKDVDIQMRDVNIVRQMWRIKTVEPRTNIS